MLDYFEVCGAYMRQAECFFQIIDRDYQGKFSVELKSENGNFKGTRTFSPLFTAIFPASENALRAKHRIGVLINI